MKKRIIALLTALLLAAGVLPFTALAAGTLTLEAGNVTAELKAGATVEVPITATANSGYGAGVLEVSWNSSALELTGVDYTDLAPKGNSAPIPTNNPGKYTIDFGYELAQENYTGTGVFFKLTFKILSSATAGDHAIGVSNFQVYDADINQLTVTGKAGNVKLTAGGGGSGGTRALALEAGSVTAALKAGATVEVPITATANTGYGAGVLEVNWNSSALELTGVDYTDLAPKGNSAPIPTNNPGKYTIDFGYELAQENYTGTGVFFKLTFKILSSATAGDHAIGLSGFQVYDVDINQLTVTGKAGKVKLTAVTKYTVSFNNGGGSGSKTSETVNAGTEYQLPAANTFTPPANKAFDQWSVTIGSNPEVKKNPGDKITVTANTTVKALWKDKAVAKYTVSFNNGGGSGSKTSETVNAGTEYQLPAANTFTPPANKEFDQWSVTIGSNPEVKKNPGDKITVTANTTVKALWKDKAVAKYTVSFDGNGGGGAMADVTGVPAGSYILPENGFTAPADKEFDQWEVAGSKYNAGDSITVDGNTTVKAIWKDKAVTPGDHIPGDVNGNGKIDSNDYALAKRAFLGTYVLDSDELMRADIDGSGKLDPNEYAMIKRHCLGTYTIPGAEGK